MKKRTLFLTTVALAASLIFSAMPTKAANTTEKNGEIQELAQSGFVHADGTQFILDGKPFYFAGTNSYNLFTLGDSSNTASIEDICTKYMYPGEIDARMQQMADMGVTVLRTWGFSNDSWHGFEPKPGEYVEPQFMLFDYIMYSAQKHGIKVIITLENYWEAYGGVDRKLQWAGLSGGTHTNRAQYFKNAQCKQWYKDYAKHFVERTNYFTGVKYKDDPTIFAWDLMNEPRYQDAGENTSGITLRKWVDEMSSYIKSIDPNHMVCAGLEGHGTEYGFGGDEGNPYVYIQQSPNIDFCSAHPYPDEEWARLTPEQNKEVVEKWIKDAHEKVGKPFVVGEFNVSRDKSYSEIEAYWRSVYDTIYENGAAGALFWQYNASPSFKDEFAVIDGDPIIDYFKEMSNKMKAKNLAGTINSISISNAQFDKSAPKDITVQLNLVNGDTLKGLKNGDAALVKGRDYIVNGNKITIDSSYLNREALGNKSIVFETSSNDNPVLKIRISDSSIVSSKLGITNVDYDRNSNNGVTVPIEFKGNTLVGILNGDRELRLGEDYEIKKDSVIINKNYLDNLNDGRSELVFKFNKGEDAALIVNVSTIEKPVMPEWDASKVYTGGEIVSYNGVLYKAEWWTQGQVPNPSDPWGVWRVYKAA